MKILIVNKFLHPNGGSETYIFKLGEELIKQGHQVQYFGMEHEGRIVGNNVNAYTTNMDFHLGSKLDKLSYPIKTIYSKEARKKIRQVLEDFQPDIVHLNNFNYQLTPSIILEIVKWRCNTGHNCKIIYTAHDYQLLCPNHMFYNPNTNKICEKCIHGKFVNCVKGKCIHGSILKSVVGAIEGYYWKRKKVYKYIDKIICPSSFMKSKMDVNPIYKDKTVVIRNFIDIPLEINQKYEKKEYVLYFGRYSQEKGIRTLIKVAKELPDIPFIFAGRGPLESELKDVPNIKNVGFKTGDELRRLIAEARFTLYPSEWYENCPMSIMESQSLGTPVIGANIGGIPELICERKTGFLHKYKNEAEICSLITKLWNDIDLQCNISNKCVDHNLIDLTMYCKELIYYIK